MSALKNKKADKELRASAEAFLTAFQAAQISDWSEIKEALEKGGGIASSQTGTVILTEDVRTAEFEFVSRAAKLLQAKAGNEKTITQIARKHGHDFASSQGDLASE